MGFNIPLSALKNNVIAPKNYLRIATCNLGTSLDAELFSKFMTTYNPDIFLFQEAYSNNQKVIESVLNKDIWRISFKDELGIASRLEIAPLEIVNRDVVGGEGILAIRYLLRLSFADVNLFNLHIKSFRKGGEAIIYEGANGISEVKRVVKSQEKECDIVSRWIKSHNIVLIGGDFNLSNANPLYKKYWSSFTDAFSKAGFGFGHTKLTRLHGVRIDHILTDGNWKIISSKVGSYVGSDHLPVIVDIVFTGKYGSQANKGIIAYNDDKTAKEALVSEDFEISLGRFRNNEDAIVMIDNTEIYNQKYSLKVEPKKGVDYPKIGLQLDDVWDLMKYPIVSFAYKISKGAPLELWVKTVYNDWLLLAKTDSGQLINDENWHETRINAKNLIQTILPAVKLIKELRFLVPKGSETAGIFWINSFRIIKDSL